MSTKKKQLLKQTDLAIQNILQGGEETLSAIYHNYRNEFLVWAESHYKIQEDEAIDIFQDAIIVFYKNILKGKITDLDSTIKTYLFAICKNMFLKHKEKKKKLILVEDMNDPVLKNIDWSVQHTSELGVKQELINEALNQLTETCSKIIHLFYYKRFSMEAIKENMGYSSEEVARTTKRKCMKKLKGIIKAMMSK